MYAHSCIHEYLHVTILFFHLDLYAPGPGQVREASHLPARVCARVYVCVCVEPPPLCNAIDAVVD